jgi:site-specific DNA-methyltransferase (adenine-specific)
MPERSPELDTIVRADCIKFLDSNAPGWVDLVFADPPFNIGYRYDGYDDSKGVEEYCNWSERWMRSVHRALKPSGSFYLAIGDEFAADLCVIARRKLGFHLRNWIIWHYTFGQQTRKRFAKSHTHILYFTKDERTFTFNADAVRVASARQTTYADSRANPKGKLPDDTWFLRPQEAMASGCFATESDTWFESRVCGTFHEREGWHGCQMPLAVLDRIIRASSNRGDVVLDPFNGSGTTVLSAMLLGRRFVGIDQSMEYVKFARKRLAHARKVLPPSGESEGEGVPSPAGPQVLEHVRKANRTSRVVSSLDALGRPRVLRKGRGKAPVTVE